MSNPRTLSLAARRLSKADPTLGAFIKKVGPCALAREEDFSSFHALASAIAHQQLTGKAAQTILGRFKDKFGEGDWPEAVRVAKAQVRSLKTCGFSTAKALALKDLAAKFLDGTVPPSAALHDMPEDEIIERLVQVRGIGRWTVEMMLMFRLGRLDVLPVDDYGVRKGFTKLYRRAELVTPKALLAFGERWRPHRSVASWYLWRAAEQL